MLYGKFMNLKKWIRCVLLFVPFCNWVVEIALRWTLFAEKKDIGSLIMAIIVTVGFGNLVGIIDGVFMIINDSMFLTDLKIGD